MSRAATFLGAAWRPPAHEEEAPGSRGGSGGEGRECGRVLSIRVVRDAGGGAICALTRGSWDRCWSRRSARDRRSPEGRPLRRSGRATQRSALAAAPRRVGRVWPAFRLVLVGGGVRASDLCGRRVDRLDLLIMSGRLPCLLSLLAKRKQRCTFLGVERGLCLCYRFVFSSSGNGRRGAEGEVRFVGGFPARRGGGGGWRPCA